MSANRTDSGPPSSRTWSAGSASVNDVALELEACLCIEEDEEFSFVHPPSIVSSHEQLTRFEYVSGSRLVSQRWCTQFLPLTRAMLALPTTNGFH